MLRHSIIWLMDKLNCMFHTNILWSSMLDCCNSIHHCQYPQNICVLPRLCIYFQLLEILQVPIVCHCWCSFGWNRVRVLSINFQNDPSNYIYQKINKYFSIINALIPNTHTIEYFSSPLELAHVVLTLEWTWSRVWGCWIRVRCQSSFNLCCYIWFENSVATWCFIENSKLTLCMCKSCNGEQNR